MTKREREQRTAEAVASLTARDPDLARAVEAGGPFHDRSRKQGFETLVLLVVEQQLSLASAAAIMGRVRGAVVPFKPETLLGMTDQRLRGLGLSGAKVKYCRALAEAFADGSLNPARLSRLDDAAVGGRIDEGQRDRAMDGGNLFADCAGGGLMFCPRAISRFRLRRNTSMNCRNGRIAMA